MKHSRSVVLMVLFLFACLSIVTVNCGDDDDDDSGGDSDGDSDGDTDGDSDGDGDSPPEKDDKVVLYSPGEDPDDNPVEYGGFAA